MTPVQRPVQIMNLLSEIVKCYRKAVDNEISANVSAAHEISCQINMHSNDMMKAGRITGLPVNSFFINIVKKKFQLTLDIPVA